MYMHYIPCRYMTSRPKIDLHGRHACMHGIYACIHDGSCCDDRQMIMHIQLHACMHACMHTFNLFTRNVCSESKIKTKHVHAWYKDVYTYMWHVIYISLIRQSPMHACMHAKALQASSIHMLDQHLIETWLCKNINECACTKAKNKCMYSNL